MNSISDSTFKSEVLNVDIPVLVDFWAPWCAPCKAVEPVLNELSKEYEGRVKIVKINTDENPISSKTYTVRGIPSLYLFKDGELVEKVVGAVPKRTLATALDKHLGI